MLLWTAEATTFISSLYLFTFQLIGTVRVRLSVLKKCTKLDISNAFLDYRHLQNFNHEGHKFQSCTCGLGSDHSITVQFWQQFCTGRRSCQLARALWRGKILKILKWLCHLDINTRGFILVLLKIYYCKVTNMKPWTSRDIVVWTIIVKLISIQMDSQSQKVPVSVSRKVRSSSS